MKKLINKFLIAMSLILFINSCDEYVDYEASEGYQIVADDYFKSAEDYEAALVGVYDILQWTLYNFMIGEIASDNSLCGGESASDVIGLQKIDDMIHDPVNDQLSRIWQYMYEGVNRANYMIENKDKMDFFVNINSTLQCPSKVPVMTVLEPGNVALAIEKIFALH